MGKENENISVRTTADFKKIVLKIASQDTFYSSGNRRFRVDSQKNQQKVPGVEGFSQLPHEDILRIDKMLKKVIILHPAGRRGR